MKRTIFFGGLVLWALAAGAEARDWGFDKDTVYEWKAGGDTVGLVNNGADTLRLDSVFAEGMDMAYWADVSFEYQALGPPFSEHVFYSYGLIQDFNTAYKMAGDKIPPGQFVLLRQFDVSSGCLAAASGDPSWTGDTLKVLLRFKSTQGEMDTLKVMGNRCPSSLIMSPKRKLRAPAPLLDRDGLGRKGKSSTRIPALIRRIVE